MSMRKYLCVILIATILLCGMAACGVGKPSVKREEQLIEDLVNAVPMLQTDINVSSLNIIKRQTIESEMCDTVYVEIEGTGAYYDCVLSYVMYYSLYDQGWLLDHAERWYDGNWYGSPTAGVPEDIIRENIIPSSSRYYGSTDWTSSLIEITDQTTNLEQGYSIISYKFAIENKYGYYLVNDCMRYEFDQESFSYYPLSVDMTDHENVQLVLSESIIGIPFTYEKSSEIFSPLAGKFNLTIDSIEDDYITGHGSYTRLHEGLDYYEDDTFDFGGTIITFKKDTTAGYDYMANVKLGGIELANGATLNIWFSLDPREGVHYIGGDLN